MTARTSFLRVSRAHAGARPAYFCASSSRAAAHEQHHEGDEREERDRREEDREPGEHEGVPVGVEREQVAGAAGVRARPQARARASNSAADGRPSRAPRTPRRPRSRARWCARPRRASRRTAARRASSADRRRTALERHGSAPNGSTRVRRPRRARTRRAGSRATRGSSHSVPSKSMPHVAARERAREQRRQKRPDAARAGEAGALSDVEEEAHWLECASGTLRRRHDDTRRMKPAGPRPGGERLQVSASRDLERYAGLFASRTRVMKSSAMRDLMAVTARPEVISLAGGLPDTSTFPPETLRRRGAADRHASRARRRSSTARPRGSPRPRTASAR